MSDKTSKTITTLTLDLVAATPARKWTMANAAAGLKSATTPVKTAAFVRGAVEAAETAGITRQVAAANATEAGLRGGLAQKDIAALLGIGESTVTQYKRLSLALGKGFHPDTTPEHWTMLGSGGMATDGEVGKALANKENTMADVKPVIEKQYKAKMDKAAGNGGPAKKATRKSTPAPEKAASPTMPRNNKGRLDQIETLLAALTNPSPKELERLAEIADTIGVIVLAAEKRADEAKAKRDKAAAALKPGTPAAS